MGRVAVTDRTIVNTTSAADASMTEGVEPSIEPSEGKSSTDASMGKADGRRIRSVSTQGLRHPLLITRKWREQVAQAVIAAGKAAQR